MICLTRIVVAVNVLVLVMGMMMMMVKRTMILSDMTGYSEQQAGIAAGVTIFTGLVIRFTQSFTV